MQMSMEPDIYVNMGRPTHIQPGEKFARLTAVKRLENYKSGQQRWLFQCDCGGQTTTSAHKVVTGYTKSCGCLAYAKDRDPITGSWIVRPGKPDWLFLANEIWARHYKDGCEFDLFLELIKQPCHYCGKLLSNTRKKNKVMFRYNGLDRIDSTKDHSPDNIVPCCRICNTAKLNLPLQEFLDWIRQVHKHLNL